MSVCIEHRKVIGFGGKTLKEGDSATASLFVIGCYLFAMRLIVADNIFTLDQFLYIFWLLSVLFRLPKGACGVVVIMGAEQHCSLYYYCDLL